MVEDGKMKAKHPCIALEWLGRGLLKVRDQQGVVREAQFCWTCRLHHNDFRASGSRRRCEIAAPHSQMSIMDSAKRHGYGKTSNTIPIPPGHDDPARNRNVQPRQEQERARQVPGGESTAKYVKRTLATTLVQDVQGSKRQDALSATRSGTSYTVLPQRRRECRASAQRPRDGDRKGQGQE